MTHYRINVWKKQRKGEVKRVHAAEMWFLRRIWRICWESHITNEEIGMIDINSGPHCHKIRYYKTKKNIVYTRVSLINQFLMKNKPVCRQNEQGL